MSNLREAIRKLEINHKAFQAFVNKVSPGLGVVFTGWANQPPATVDAWVMFMVKEAMPRNREILEHLSKVYPEGDYAPPPLVLDFRAYVFSYNALIEAWADGTLSPYDYPTIGVNFPAGLDDFLYQELGDV